MLPEAHTRSRSSVAWRSSRRSLDRPLLGVSELAHEVGLNRSHHAPLHLDARDARLPPAGRGRRSKYRLGPRVLDLGFSAINSMELREISAPASAAAQRRDRPHGQHGDARRRRHRLHRALPQLAPGPARDRPQPARRLAAAGLLHVDGQGAARVLPDERAARRARPGAVRAARARTPSPSGGAARRSSRASATRASRSTTRSSPTGCARSPRPSASQTGEVVAAINLAVHRSLVSIDDLVDRLGPALKRTADEISARIGFSGV